MTNEFILVVFLCILLAGMIIGAWLKERAIDHAEKKAPYVPYQVAPVHTDIPISALEAFLKNPRITVRHKQIKSKPKVNAVTGKGINALIRDSLTVAQDLPPKVPSKADKPEKPGQLKYPTMWTST